MVAPAASLTTNFRRPLRDGKARHVSPRTPPRDARGVVAPHLHHVDGPRYIDSVILRDRDTSSDGVTDERIYYAQDSQFNVTALVNTGGTVLERYAYTPYGERTVFTASWTGLTATAYNNTVSYTGQRLDAESNLHHFRNGYYSADLGRFITRDPLGYVDGMSLYGGYFALWAHVDPLGQEVGVDVRTGRGYFDPEHEVPFGKEVQDAIQALCPCATIGFSKGNNRDRLSSSMDGSSIKTEKIEYLQYHAEPIDGTTRDETCDCLEAHKAGCSLVESTLTAAQLIIINYAQEGNFATHREGTALFTSYDNILSWDPYQAHDEEIVSGPDDSRNIHILGHELHHQYELTGRYRGAEGRERMRELQDGIPRAEIRAVRVQNQLYNELTGNADARATYGGRNVPDPNALELDEVDVEAMADALLETGWRPSE